MVIHDFLIYLFILFRNIQESSGIHHDSIWDRHSQALPHTDVIGSAPGSTRADLGFGQPHNSWHADQGGALHCTGTNWCRTGKRLSQGKVSTWIHLMNNLQWWPHSLLMNAIRGRENGDKERFFLKRCKLSIFLYSNLVWQGLLIFLAWVCPQNPREDGNPQAAHETLHATAYMRGIIRHLWQCKSSGVLNSCMEERF